MITINEGKSKAYLSYAFELPDESIQNFLDSRDTHNKYAILTDELSILNRGEIKKAYNSFAILYIAGDTIDDVRNELNSYKENYLKNLLNGEYLGVFFDDILPKKSYQAFDLYAQFISDKKYNDILLQYNLLDIYQYEPFKLSSLIKDQPKKIKRKFINDLFNTDHNLSKKDYNYLKRIVRLFSY